MNLPDPLSPEAEDPIAGFRCEECGYWWTEDPTTDCPVCGEEINALTAQTTFVSCGLHWHLAKSLALRCAEERRQAAAR